MATNLSIAKPPEKASVSTYQQSTLIEWRNPHDLKPHKLNHQIYGDDGFQELIPSVKELGILQAIYCLADNTIISGHRRWRASLEAKLTSIPTITVKFPSEIYEHQAIIEHNRYRIKNGQQLYNEGKELEEIEAEKAKQRQGTRTDLKPDFVQNFAQSSEYENKARHIIAKTIGLGSGEQWRRLNIIAEHKPQLLETIKPGKRSLNSAYKEICREQKREAISELSPREIEGKFNVILADPPWHYKNDSTAIRGVSDDFYPTMTPDKITTLPITQHVLSNAVLFMWTTNSMLHHALHIIEAWGFEFKTSMVWVKDRIGTGFFIRSKHELLLIATRGQFLPMTTELPESVIFAPRLGHSQKPDKIYSIIETMYPKQLYAELFATKTRVNWYSWGLEIESDGN